MKRKSSFPFLLFILFIALFTGTGSAEETSDQATASIYNEFGKLPMYFIKNQGQLEKKVVYYEKGSGHATYFAKDGVYLNLTSMPSKAAKDLFEGSPEELFSQNLNSETIKLSLLGANKTPEITAIGRQPGKINYLAGNDRSKWKSNVPAYGSILYKEAYKGIDVRYYGNNTKLEYDVIVKPGADPKQVKFAYEGINGLKALDNGDLEISLKERTIYQKKPYIYQEKDGKKVQVDGRFTVSSSPVSKDGKRNFTYGFEVASYDKSRELVIDPYLVYSTYLGGGKSDYAYAIAVDGSGNAYVTGTTGSLDFSISYSALQPSIVGSTDVFITKLDPSGALVYSTYLGGSLSDTGWAIATDSSGNAYVTGTTSSTDFPISPSAFQPLKPGGIDAFVTKLDATGGMVYSTYLGGGAADSGSPNEYGYGIAVDGSGNAYITGETGATDFPITPSAFQPLKAGYTDAFVTKLDANGGMVYSTYLGGGTGDFARGIAVDASGNIYVTGQTVSTDFPVSSSALQASYAGYTDAFVTKLDANGGMAYSTYLGGRTSDYGTANDIGDGIAVDGSGNAYITGYTASIDFPTTPSAFQPFKAGRRDIFVTKLDVNGGMAYSTYLGGSVDDLARGIAVDASGNVYVTGQTVSTDFPVSSSALQPSNAGGNTDAFITKLNAEGAMTYSTYFGAESYETGYGIAVDGSGNAYVAGVTWSATFPTTPSALQPTYKTIYSIIVEGFVTKMNTNIQPALSYPSEPGYDDAIEPNTGTATTVFTYKAVYTDPDNKAPSYVRACVDGVCNPMYIDTGAASPLNDGKYSNGEQYIYTTTLAAGPHSYYFEASNGTDAVRLPSSGAGALTVSDLAIPTSALPDGIVGLAYGKTVTATGGVSPYTWSVPSGLPPGLSLNPSTGDITGTPVSPGAYGFTVRVTDSIGIYESKSLSIVIAVDTTAPVISVPPDMTVDATSPGGASVIYTASATDNVDPHPALNCVPASGSTFPIGANAVTCTASDNVGNSSTAVFHVDVLGAADIINQLITMIGSYNLNQGVAGSINAKITNALAAASGGNSTSVCNKIGAFVNEVNAQTGKAITAAQSADLLSIAASIKNAQGCQ